MKEIFEIADCTKEDPGPLFALLHYLSEKTGISISKKTIYESWKDAQFQDNVRYVLNGKLLPPLQKIYRPGRVLMLTDRATRKMNIAPDTKFDEIFSVEMRPLHEFGVKINIVGNHTITKNEKWVSEQPLYEVDGYYFTRF